MAGGLTMYYTPKADKDGMIGEGVRFERIRRITGYLVGGLDRFNNAKRAEEREWVKHGLGAYQI